MNSAVPTGIVYDAGALVAAERSDGQMWSLHRRVLGRGLRPIVPSVVLAQAWRGGPQHDLSRLLKGCVIEAVAENAARAIGTLLAVSRTSDVVDAAVAISAASRGDMIVTSDPDDLTTLATALGTRLVLHEI